MFALPLVSDGSKLLAMTQAPGAAASAPAFNFAITSSIVSQTSAPTLMKPESSALVTMCTCGSMKPGKIVAPCASITSVSAPFMAVISPRRPIATIRPFLTAIASAVGWPGFIVRIVAPRKILSGAVLGFGTAAQTRRGAASVRAAPASSWRREVRYRPWSGGVQQEQDWASDVFIAQLVALPPLQGNG